MSYHVPGMSHDGSNGMHGMVDYGEPPTFRIKLKLGPEPQAPTPRRVNPSPVVVSEYDTRTSARGARTQQFTKSGTMAVDAAGQNGNMMEGVEMMMMDGSGGAVMPQQHPYGSSKKNTRGMSATSGGGSGGGGSTASKDVRSSYGHPMQQHPHHHMQQHPQMMNMSPGMQHPGGVPASPMASRAGQVQMMGARGQSSGGMVGNVGMGGPGTPVQQQYRGNVPGGTHAGMHTPGGMSAPGGMVGAPAPYMQSPGTPGGYGTPQHHGNSGVGAPGSNMGMHTPMTPSSTPYIQRNLRNTSETPMTPGTAAYFAASAPSPMAMSQDVDMAASQGLGGAEEAGSNLGSDDEDGDDKSKSKNKRAKPKNRASAGAGNRKKDEDDIFGDEDPQTAGYNAAIQLWKTVEAYFADFTDEDYRIVAVDQKDDAFRTPSLGKKSAALIASQSSGHGGQPGQLQQSQSDMMMDMAPKVEAGLFGGPNGPSFFTRLVSCLVEEAAMPSLSHFLTTRPMLQDIPMTQAEQDPMFGVVSQQEAEFVEAKLKKELMSLGLWGEIETPSSPSANGTTANGGSTSSGAGASSASNPAFKDTRSSSAAAKEAAAKEEGVDDDDEVLSELKKLQAKLRVQLETNNAIKNTLRQQMDSANGARKKAKEERDALNKLDSSYVAQHKIIKKKKKPIAKTTAAGAPGKANASKVKSQGAQDGAAASSTSTS